MKWYIPVGAAAIGLGVFLVARSSKSSSAPRRVIVVGDSLVGGNAFRSALKQKLPDGCSLEVRSYVGQGTGHILDKVGEALMEKPTHIVILAGVNDLTSGRGTEVIKMNLNEAYRASEVAGVTPIGVRLTPWAGNAKGAGLVADTISVNAWMQADAGVKVVRTESLGSSDGALWNDYDAGDGLHLSAAGQQALAALIAKRI